MNREALLHLTKDEMIEFDLAQAAQIAVLSARVAALDARLGAAPKTPGNSSTPPSRGQKPNHPERPKPPRRGRPGVTRRLSAHPDRIKQNFESWDFDMSEEDLVRIDAIPQTSRVNVPPFQEFDY